jgi:hypothetical protein
MTIVKNLAMINKSSNILFKALIMTQVLSVVVASFFIYQYLNNNNNSNYEAKSLQKSLDVKQSLSKLILLNDGVEPAIATIKDVDALKKDNAEFYKDAVNGNFLVIFPKRAIIYDAGKNIIVNVAPILSSGNNPTLTPSISGN